MSTQTGTTQWAAHLSLFCPCAHRHDDEQTHHVPDDTRWIPRRNLIAVVSLVCTSTFTTTRATATSTPTSTTTARVSPHAPTLLHWIGARLSVLVMSAPQSSSTMSSTVAAPAAPAMPTLYSPLQTAHLDLQRHKPSSTYHHRSRLSELSLCCNVKYMSNSFNNPASTTSSRRHWTDKSVVASLSWLTWCWIVV